MHKFDFDAELRGADGAALPVYCDVQLPYVGGQKAQIRLAVPARHISKKPPSNPCTLSGKSGAFTINMQGVNWRRFPCSAKSKFGLEAIELLHIERLTVLCPPINARRDIRFHLAPISYLRSEASFVHFGDRAGSNELFVLDLPGLGSTSFVAEWVTNYHRDAEIPGATVIAGFSAVANLPPGSPVDSAQVVAQFKTSLEALSVLFRQAVSLHGWTLTDGETVSTWIAPLEPKVTPCARDDRGDFVARPHEFVECATSLVDAYRKADSKTRSLVRHLSVAVNPHSKSRAADRFLFMYSALERAVEVAWKQNQTPQNPHFTTKALTGHLEQLRKAVADQGGENALEISARLKGLIDVANRPGIRDKLQAFVRAYPMMASYCRDLWPILGSDRRRGLREIRNALAHGSRTSVSSDVLAVAEWHLAILLERVIFMLLGLTLPDGISPGSILLRTAAMGWYEPDQWGPLQSKLGPSI